MPVAESLEARYENIGTFAADHELDATEWTVVTGGTTSGKTTVCSVLATEGYPVVQEAHRIVIEELKAIHAGAQQGTGEDFTAFRTSNEQWIREAILDATAEFENGLADFKSLPLILERAVPDQLAWFTWSGLDEGMVLGQINNKYKHVARLALLPFVDDGVRIANDNRRRLIHELLRFGYESLGYPVFDIDGSTAEERALSLREILPVPPLRGDLDEINDSLASLTVAARDKIQSISGEVLTSSLE